MLNLLVIAHPDDEILGYGGTGCVSISKGEIVQPIILCGQVNARTNKPNNTKLLSDIEKANSFLGFNKPVLAGYPNLQMNTLSHIDIVKFIEEQIIKFSPNRIFTHHPNDLNNDHHIVANACMAASRVGQRNSSLDMFKGLYFMEILSSTEWSYDIGHLGFNPNIFVDISTTINDKINSLRCYEGVIRDSPHPRSVDVIKSLANFRGAQVGYKYAEAFQVCYQRGLDV